MHKFDYTRKRKLRLENVPGNINVDQLASLCAVFGSVSNVVLLEGGIAFVEMDSRKQCKRVFKGLKTNKHGITLAKYWCLKETEIKTKAAEHFTNMKDIRIITGRRKLCFTKVPKNIDVDQLKSLCEAFGSVRSAMLLEGGGAYVEMDKKRNCKRAYEALKMNDFGIIVEKCLSMKQIIKKRKEAEYSRKMDEIDTATGRTILRLTEVPANIGADQIRWLCETFGDVISVLLLEGGLAYVEINTKTKCNRVYGGINFSDLGITIERRLPVRQAVQKLNGTVGCLTNMDEIDIVAGRTQLRLTQVPENFDADFLRWLCEYFGRVLNVILLMGGIAYIKMDTQKSAERALKGLNGTNLEIVAERCASFANQIRKTLEQAENYLNVNGIFVGRTKLRLTRVPESLDVSCLRSLCGAFGRVLNVDLHDGGLAYVQMDTPKDRERTFQGLKTNAFGITVEKCLALKQMWIKPKEDEYLVKRNGPGVVGRPKLRLTNLSKKIETNFLRLLAERFGGNVKVVVQKGGLAYVEMDTNRTCQRTYELIKTIDPGIILEKCFSKWTIWSKHYPLYSRVYEVISFENWRV